MGHYHEDFILEAFCYFEFFFDYNFSSDFLSHTAMASAVQILFFTVLLGVALAGPLSPKVRLRDLKDDIAEEGEWEELEKSGDCEGHQCCRFCHLCEHCATTCVEQPDMKGCNFCNRCPACKTDCPAETPSF